MKIRIVSNGSFGTTTVTDVDTGKPVGLIQSIQWCVGAQQQASCWTTTVTALKTADGNDYELITGVNDEITSKI